MQQTFKQQNRMNLTKSSTTTATTTPLKHCLVLDVDHTFLSGVTSDMYNTYHQTTGGFCQTFTYPPSVKRRAKYMKRAKAEAYAPNATGKMVHYKVPTPDDGKLLTFFVAVRPCISYLVSRHDELFNKENGTCTILLASANDDERTLAVLECLTYEGRTLTEISNARFIPRAEFLENYEDSRSGSKRIHDMRAWAESQQLLTKDGTMIFLDDKAPRNCCGTIQDGFDQVFNISSWDLDESLQIFEQHLQEPMQDRVFVPTKDIELMDHVIQLLKR